MSKRSFFKMIPLFVVASMSFSGLAHAQEAPQIDASEFVQVDARHGGGEAEPADDRGVDARRGEAEPADNRGVDG